MVNNNYLDKFAWDLFPNCRSLLQFKSILKMIHTL